MAWVLIVEVKSGGKCFDVLMLLGRLIFQASRGICRTVEDNVMGTSLRCEHYN